MTSENIVGIRADAKEKGDNTSWDEMQTRKMVWIVLQQAGSVGSVAQKLLKKC